MQVDRITKKAMLVMRECVSVMKWATIGLAQMMTMRIKALNCWGCKAMKSNVSRLTAIKNPNNWRI